MRVEYTLTYRVIIWRERRNIDDENLHFVDKISLEIGLNLYEMSLRFSLEKRKKQNQCSALNVINFFHYKKEVQLTPKCWREIQSQI